MKIQPTKQWLKDNPHNKECFWENSKGYKIDMPDNPGCEFEIKNCHSAVSERDKYNCGWCVGINLDKKNLDKIRLCHATPIGRDDWSGPIIITPLEMTANEALGMACFLNIAVADYIQLDPEHREEMGKMRRIKAKAKGR